MSRITNLRALVPKLTQMGKTETVTGMVDGSKVTASFHDGKLKSIFTDGDTTPVDSAVIHEIIDFYALTSRASFSSLCCAHPNAADAGADSGRDDE